MDWKIFLKPTKSKIILSIILFVLLFYLLGFSLTTFVETPPWHKIMASISLVVNIIPNLVFFVLFKMNLIDIFWITVPIAFIVEIGWCYFLASLLIAIKQKIFQVNR